MLTYIALNLNRKKFYVGSAINFDRRQRQHLGDSATDWYHNDLRREPEKFFWFISMDDGLDTRDEEQYYLDFYHGSKWCYNVNPSAVAPPSHIGTKWYTNGENEKRVSSEEAPPNGWIEGRKNETKNAQSQAMAGKPWTEKRKNVLESYITEEYRTKAASGGAKMKGKKRWTNGIDETVAFECPGEDWKQGRRPSYLEKMKKNRG